MLEGHRNAVVRSNRKGRRKVAIDLDIEWGGLTEGYYAKDKVYSKDEGPSRLNYRVIDDIKYVFNVYFYSRDTDDIILEIRFIW